VADGLWPSADKGATQVKISQGFAIDILGNEIELDNEYNTEDLSYLAGKSPFITIEWNEVDADVSTEAGGAGVTRKELKPIIRVSADTPKRGQQLILGTVTLDSAGRVSAVDTSSALRTIAGAQGGDLVVVSLTVKGLNIDPSQQPRLGVSTPGQADLKGNLQVNGNLGVTGNVGIGTSSPGARLEIAGTTAAAGVLRLDGGDSGSGAANVAQIAFGYNGTAQYPSFIATRHDASAPSNAILFYTGDGTANGVFPTNAVLGLAISNGSAGIGVTSPVTRLQINPKIRDDAGRALDSNALMVVHPTPTAAAALNDPRDILYLGRQGTAGQSYGALASYKLSRYENAGPSNAGSRTRLDLALTHDSFNDAVTMTWLSSGNVGIGTTTPQAPLDIGGATPNNPQAIFTRGSDANFQLYAANGASNAVGSVQATFGLRYAGVGDIATLSFLRGSGAKDASLAFSTQGAERMRIDSGGNIGIGISAPGSRLDVSDRIRLRQGAAGSAGIWLYQTTPNKDRAFIGMANDNQVGLWGNNGIGWGLLMDVTNGNVEFAGRATDKKIRAVVAFTNQVSTGSTTYVDIQNMNLNINAPVSATFQMLVQVNGVQAIRPSDGSLVAVYFRLLVDGGQLDVTRHEFNHNGWELRGVNLSRLLTLPAGPHAISVQWMTTVGTATCCWYNDTRSIQVIEL
jgi:hypothetical protein